MSTLAAAIRRLDSLSPHSSAKDLDTACAAIVACGALRHGRERAATAAIARLGNLGAWPRACAMLARMERADGASFVAAIGACARSRGAAPPACERALALLAEV